MKHWLFCCFMVVLLWILPAAAHADGITPDIFRLHVVADSDSAEDQALKLAVRDAVLHTAQDLLADAQSADEAVRLTEENRHLFRNAAVQALADAGRMQPVQVETGIFDFPDRIYGDVRVPAGRYRAMKVTLGRGMGHNWWCVLYPTLCCFDESAINEDGSISFYSHTLRFLIKLFGGDGA